MMTPRYAWLLAIVYVIASTTYFYYHGANKTTSIVCSEGDTISVDKQPDGRTYTVTCYAPRRASQ